MAPLLTVELAEYLYDRVRRFELEAPATQRWLAPAVRSNQALPLSIGWTAVIGIRADGRLVDWSTEDEYAARDVEDRIVAIHALVVGSIRYAPLRALLPVRAPASATCGTCGGTGRFVLPVRREGQRSDFPCGTCGGLGWIDPGPAR